MNPNGQGARVTGASVGGGMNERPRFLLQMKRRFLAQWSFSQSRLNVLFLPTTAFTGKFFNNGSTFPRAVKEQSNISVAGGGDNVLLLLDVLVHRDALSFSFSLHSCNKPIPTTFLHLIFPSQWRTVLPSTVSTDSLQAN